MEFFFDALLSAVLITGLVIIMMMLLEYLNVTSAGRMGEGLRHSRFGQVLLGGFLGVIPGCVGGFAGVSLYSHGVLSFGALVAMLIASSGDEAFVMLAMFPGKALLLFGVLFVIGVAAGLLVDLFKPHHHHKEHNHHGACEGHFDVHSGDSQGIEPSWKNLRGASWRRIVLLVGIAAFIVALALGMLEHEHEPTAGGHFNIFDEYWINLVFAVCSLFVLWFTAVGSDHFVDGHLWNHVVKKHLLRIFLWSFGALLVIEAGMHFFDLEALVKGNIPFIILMAVLIGLIPESGPHLIFVTMFAGGLIPFSVLLASSISQDGHASLPLLAESKSGFVKAKAVNALVAAIAGYALYFAGL
ncbi:MAG: arsenic efflux protein [Bacteroidales bacterium]|nr:arsenic efflux protein [Bacteroidales bacterium]